MKYRKFGSSEWQSSILGFGAAGIRLCEDTPESFEPAIFADTIRVAIDRGINFLDVGYPFDLRKHARMAGAIGRALLDGYRGRVKIAVTIPSRLHSKSDLDRYLDAQISLINTDSFQYV